MMKIFIALLILFGGFQVNAQMINRWSDVYSTEGSLLNYYRNNNLQSLDKDNILLIDDNNLILTKDGGLNWEKIFEAKNNNYEINSIAYINKDKIIWVGDTALFQGNSDYSFYYQRSGIYYISSDGGVNWVRTRLDSNTMLNYVVMFDENTGIINKHPIGNRYNSEISYRDTLIYTNDFFNHYIEIEVPDSMSFVDKIYMFGKDNFIIHLVNSVQKTNKYLETTDRGSSWKEFSDATDISDLFFLNRQFAYKIVKAEKPNTMSKIKNIYKTTDGGKEWIYCFTPQDTYNFDYGVLKINASDIDNAIAVGGNCAIFRTNDGGINWQQEFVPNITSSFAMNNEGILDITFPDKENAYIISSKYVFKMNGEKTLSRPMLNRYYDRINPNKIKAFWEPVAGATSYLLQISLATGSVYNESVFDNSVYNKIITGTSVILPDFEYNSCYYARIKAISGNLESEWNIRANMFCTLKSSEHTEQPEFLYPKKSSLINSTTCEFKWNKIEGAEEYNFQFAKDPFYFNIVKNYESYNDTVLIVENLIVDSVYYARVKVTKGSKITEWSYTYFRVAELSSEVYFENEINIGNLNIFPNPSSDFITIQFSNKELQPFAESAKVQIFDVLGIEVGQSSLIDNTTHNNSQSGMIDLLRIDVSHLPVGVYFIRFGNKVEKFVKM